MENKIKTAEEIWNNACRATLSDIANAFLINKDRGATEGDKIVFKAISETIKNFPIPEFIEPKKEYNGLHSDEEPETLDYKIVKNKMCIAAKIQDALDASDMSKKEFAFKMNVVPSMVTRWRSGGHNFTVETLTEIEHVLNVKLINSKLRDEASSEIESLKSEIAELKEGLIMAKEYTSNTNVIEAINKLIK